MKKILFALLSLFISCEAFAQSGGFPSRPTFQTVTTIGATGLTLKGTVAASAKTFSNVTDAVADQKYTYFYNNGSSTGLCYATDASPANCAATPLLITRSGANASQIDLNAAAVNINGLSVGTKLSGIVTSLQSITSNTTLADVAGLTVTLPSATTGRDVYEIHVRLSLTGSSTGAGGYKVALTKTGTGTTGESDPASAVTSCNGVGASGRASWTATPITCATTLVGAGGGDIVDLFFVVTVTTQPGIVKVQAAQNSSSTDSLFVKATSFIVARKL